MTRTETDILIAGGGNAGLAAAAAFAAEGFSVICADPMPPVSRPEDPGSDLRSTAFLMPSIRLLEAADLWPSLAPHAAPLRVMRLIDAGGPDGAIRETADFVADELGEPCFGYNIPNWLLRETMLDALRGAARAEIRMGARVEAVTARSTGALARLSDGTTIAAALVIAADGRDSMLREAAGIGARRWGYGQKAIVFSVSHPLPHEDISTEIHRTGGPFTLVPLAAPDDAGREGHRSAVVWMELGPRAVELAGLPEDAFEAELNARSCGVLGHLTLESPRRVWPIIAQVAERLDGPRMALIAEAAHVVPPIGAQGLNMSLRDVAVLRDLCVKARDAGADIGAGPLLRRYDRLRRPDILARAAGIDTLNRAAIEANQSLRNLRREGLHFLRSVTPVRRSLMRAGLGLGR